MRVLGLLVARGGSRRLPGKNLRLFRGEALIVHTVRAARAAATLSHVVISTDDPAIACVAAAHGCAAPFLRPESLARDDSGSVEVALHALDALEATGDRYDALALLQPTSPLRRAADIDGCVTPCLEGRAPATILVARPPKPPSHHRLVGADGRLDPQPVDQALGDRRLVAITGGCYAVMTAVLRRDRSFTPPGTLAVETPWLRAADIDTLEDMLVAEALATVLDREPQASASAG